VVELAQREQAESIAFTYNDPTIFGEFVIDIAQAARQAGVATIMVTAGYIDARAREEIYAEIDAVNVDLKAFTDDFYRKLTFSNLQPVLETIAWLVHQTDVWVELTNLIIPDHNDAADEIAEMSDWILEALGDAVPIHFTAFHPDWKMMDKENTPLETVVRARRIAIKNGIRYAYTGNVHDPEGDATYCHDCGEVLIGRDWYVLSDWKLTDQGHCLKCGTACSGVFDGPPGDWGAKRMPVRLRTR